MAKPMAERLIFRYCPAVRCGDGEVTRPPPDGIGGLSAKVMRRAGKSTRRAEALKYAISLRGAAIVPVTMLPRKPAKLQPPGTRTVNGHTWSG